jgi:hypothetical protein
VDFDAVADELYGLAPEDFTPTRNQRAKQARAEGDKALADLVTSLRKPTVAAWLTNQLVRAHADEVELLLELGRELREVMADLQGAELRELTKQRYQLVSALVQQARSLAYSRGRKVTDDVAQAVRTTLEATLSDDASAEQVAAGRLSEALDVSGFGAGGTQPAKPRPRPDAASAPAGDKVADLEAQRRRHEITLAKREVEAAKTTAQRSEDATDRAEAKVRSLEHEHQQAEETLAELRRQLDQAESAVTSLEQQASEAHEAAEQARAAAREANSALASAQQRLKELSEPPS